MTTLLSRPRSFTTADTVGPLAYRLLISIAGRLVVLMQSRDGAASLPMHVLPEVALSDETVTAGGLYVDHTRALIPDETRACARLCVWSRNCGATWAGLYATRRPPGLRAAIFASPL